jgi:acetyl-CoA carboxylase biotin carboxyl carrier protein
MTETVVMDQDGDSVVSGGFLPDPPGQGLSELRAQAEQFIAAAGRPVRRVVLRAGEYTLEVEWQDAHRPAPAEQASGPEVLTAVASDSVGGAAEVEDEGTVVVNAPLVGMFYRSPAPADPPFVEVGATVVAGTQLAVIEAMKLMNEITAPASGRVVEVLAKDHELVEFGQPLFRLAVDGA